jgi:Ca2+-binding EF-hand superfamily protein
MKRTAPNNPSFKNGATPASLASTTVADAFDNFDADSSGQLSLNEFVRFVEIFSGPSAATGGNASTRQVTVALSEVIKAFESMNASDIASKICELTKDDKTLDRAKFGDFILTEVNKDLNYGGIFELFDALDRDGNNSLTASEVGGILLLCGDSDAKSKASAAFRLYDKDGSNSLCPEELFEYVFFFFFSINLLCLLFLSTHSLPRSLTHSLTHTHTHTQVLDVNVQTDASNKTRFGITGRWLRSRSSRASMCEGDLY